MLNSLQLSPLKKHDEKIITIANFLVATFFITVLSFKKGYSIVPMVLGIISTLLCLFYYLKLKIRWQLDNEDKCLIFSLIAYFFTFAISTIFNGDGIRVIDNPSRILIFIPLIIFFYLYPIKKVIIFHSIPIGSMIIGLLAIYQKFFLELSKPFPGIMSIQAGDIAIAIAIFSITISFYWFSKNQNKVGIIYLIFGILGITASILSGARGGWISLPFAILCILICYYKHLNKKIFILIISTFIISISFFILRPEFGLEKRYESAQSDIINYINKGIKNSSQGARLDMWENGLVAIREKPILGHGSSGYEEFKQKQVTSKQMAKTTIKFNSLHNQYLEAFVKRGAIGFAGLMAILLVPLVIFTRRLNSNSLDTRCIAVLGIVHIISHMFFFLTQSFLAHNSGSIFYFFVLILLYHLIKQKEHNP